MRATRVLLSFARALLDDLANAWPRSQVAYPFQAYLATEAAAFRADVADTLDTALNFII